MNAVANLYDDLFNLNSKRNKKESYPIHKSLVYENKKIKTLYDFLLAEFDIANNGYLLDCGCGVGYGSMLIAEQKFNLKVHGISLSEKEIELANNQCANRNLQDVCKFKIQSFDDVPADTYDCIIAIESLKHSPNIKKTMNALSASLRPNGKLFIIEDVGKKPIGNFASRRQCEDWHLPKICTVEDYQNSDKLINKQVLNMTPFMKTPNLIYIFFRIMIAEFLVGLENLGLRKSTGAKITRGGFYQELLYATDKIDYLILTASKVS